jgi:hypothetical protein
MQGNRNQTVENNIPTKNNITPLSVKSNSHIIIPPNSGPKENNGHIWLTTPPTIFEERMSQNCSGARRWHKGGYYSSGKIFFVYSADLMLNVILSNTSQNNSHQTSAISVTDKLELKALISLLTL